MYPQRSNAVSLYYVRCSHIQECSVISVEFVFIKKSHRHRFPPQDFTVTFVDFLVLALPRLPVCVHVHTVTSLMYRFLCVRNFTVNLCILLKRTQSHCLNVWSSRIKEDSTATYTCSRIHNITANHVYFTLALTFTYTVFTSYLDTLQQVRAREGNHRGEKHWWSLHR